MIITELIRQQVLQVTVMFGAGITVALFRQIMRLLCCSLKTGKVTYAVTELLFWIAAALWTAEFLDYCAHGALSLHSALGFAGGIILWQVCFCDIIDKIKRNSELRQKLRIKHGKEKKKQSV